MIRVNVRETRKRLAELLSAAQSGQTVEVTRRGKIVARIVPPISPKHLRLPDLTEFRASLGKPRRITKRTIAVLRNLDRY